MMTTDVVSSVSGRSALDSAPDDWTLDDVIRFDGGAAPLGSSQVNVVGEEEEDGDTIIPGIADYSFNDVIQQRLPIC